MPAGPPPAPLGAVPPAGVIAPAALGQLNGRLQIDPPRLVAPIGTEVVLRAGLCDEDGYLVTRQPIEWMLSGDSAGTLIDVNTQGQPLWDRLNDSTPPKRSGSYAVSWTSTVAQVLTRGTPSTADDVWLQEGQTWISLSSATGGASHVTVVARTEDGWEQRRQTATIYWVDGRWVFPSPVAGRAGQAQPLTTRVTRQSDGAPLAGWLVRYQIVDGAPAALDSNGSQVIDVRTDAQGNATVAVIPQGSESGVTCLNIQVIRTASDVGDMPRLVVGEGASCVTWNAAGLSVTTAGPSTAELGATLAYSIQVSNPGDLPASGLVVSSEVPNGLEYVSSEPPAEVFGNRLQWRVDQLAVRELQPIQVHFRAARAGQIRYCVTARVGEGTARESCATTTVTASPHAPSRGALAGPGGRPDSVPRHGDQHGLTAADECDRRG